jgi:hypothetical protein
MPILFLVVFIGVVIFQYLRRNYANMREFMTSLNRGVVPTDRLVQDKTEIGVLNKQINETADIFKKLTLFSHEIAQGIYDTEIGIEAPDGSMAKSLLELRNRLSETQKEETKRHLEDEQRNWTTQGLAKFGDIMRHSNENISSLSDEVIKNLVHYINASQGGLFIFDDSDPNNVFLEMQSAFAYDRKKYLTKKNCTWRWSCRYVCSRKEHLIYYRCSIRLYGNRIGTWRFQTQKLAYRTVKIRR